MCGGGGGGGGGESNVEGKSKRLIGSFITAVRSYKCMAEVEFTYLVFTRMPGESCRRRLRSLLLCLCYVFLALINSLVC